MKFVPSTSRQGRGKGGNRGGRAGKAGGRGFISGRGVVQKDFFRRKGNGNIFPIEVKPMGRTGATLKARLSVLIDACIELSVETGRVNVGELAERVDLTDRLIRSYLRMLQALGLLQYVGAGTYQIDQDLMQEKAKEITTGLKGPRITLDDFIGDPKYVTTILETSPLRPKVEEVLERLEYTYAFPEETRAKLREFRIEEYPEFVGESLIEQERAQMVYLDRMAFIGSASVRRIKNFKLFDFSYLSLAYFCSAAYTARFLKDLLMLGEGELVLAPSLETFKGSEPFIEGEPFYELGTDFPELLAAGRAIAARYLEKIQQYNLELEVLKRVPKDETKPLMLIHQGALIPHGFIVESRILRKLRDRSQELFYKLMQVAKRQEVLLVGISTKPRDDYFYRKVREQAGMDFGRHTDYSLFFHVMRDGDFTCLVKRGKERGRPAVEQLYEFYMMSKGEVLKAEFVALEDPLEERRRIVDITYTTHEKKPRSELTHGPSPLIAALDRANLYARNLEHLLMSTLMASTATLYEKIDSLREKFLQEKYLEGGE